MLGAESSQQFSVRLGALFLRWLRGVWTHRTFLPVLIFWYLGEVFSIFPSISLSGLCWQQVIDTVWFPGHQKLASCCYPQMSSIFRSHRLICCLWKFLPWVECAIPLLKMKPLRRVNVYVTSLVRYFPRKWEIIKVPALQRMGREEMTVVWRARTKKTGSSQLMEARSL